MYSNLLNLEPNQIPTNFDLQFRKIIHATSLQNAVKILEKGGIFGDFYNYSLNAEPIHANFFVSLCKDYSLAKNKEVQLHFDWIGEQYATAVNIIGKRLDKSCSNTLFHVYSREDEGQFNPLRNYWQSIIHPNSTKLRFNKILLSDLECSASNKGAIYEQICCINSEYEGQIIKVM